MVLPFWEVSHPYHIEKFPTANRAETGSSCQEWCDRGRLWQNAGTPDEVPGCQRKNKLTDSFLPDLASHVTSVVQDVLLQGEAAQDDF